MATTVKAAEQNKSALPNAVADNVPATLMEHGQIKTGATVSNANEPPVSYAALDYCAGLCDELAASLRSENFHEHNGAKKCAEAIRNLQLAKA